MYLTIQKMLTPELATFVQSIHDIHSTVLLRVMCNCGFQYPEGDIKSLSDSMGTID